MKEVLIENSQEEQILEEAEYNINKLEKHMDNPNVDNISVSIDDTINNINKFYLLIDKVKKDEEKLDSTFYYDCVGHPLCCLKGKYKDNESINNRINNINSKKENIQNILLKIRDNYMKGNNFNTIKIIPEKKKISGIMWYFLIISIFHYVAMTEIEGILYSLFGEIKKGSIYLIYDKYNTNKTFTDFLEESTLTDTAQINFNYIFSCLSPYFIKNKKLKFAYFIIAILIVIWFMISLTVTFLDKQQLVENVPYNYGTFALIIIIYIFIYFFASLISLIPHKILMKDKDFSCLHLLLINFF